MRQILVELFVLLLTILLFLFGMNQFRQPNNSKSTQPQVVHPEVIIKL